MTNVRGPKAREGRLLPWGWWLTQVGSYVEDGKGGRWRSVREAFWEGRLGMPANFVPEQQELLLRVLTAIEHRWRAPSENQKELFGGDLLFWRFYMCWLVSIGFTTPDRYGGPLHGPLTEEGLQVRLMLSATAEEKWADVAMGDVVDAVRRAHHGDAERLREAALQAFERETSNHTSGFVRKSVGGKVLVTLAGFRNEGRMPIRRTFWSMEFPDADSRDDFYGWLAERFHRWDDWAELAFGRGGDALTRHLLGLMFADPSRGERSG